VDEYTPNPTAADRRYVDDVAGATRTHRRQYRPGHIGHAKHVGLVQAARLGERGRFHRAHQSEAGVVDQHVDAKDLACVAVEITVEAMPTRH
jgi:hypothetical protein